MVGLTGCRQMWASVVRWKWRRCLDLENKIVCGAALDSELRHLGLAAGMRRTIAAEGV